MNQKSSNFYLIMLLWVNSQISGFPLLEKTKCDREEKRVQQRNMKRQKLKQEKKGKREKEKLKFWVTFQMIFV